MRFRRETDHYIPVIQVETAYTLPLLLFCLQSSCKRQLVGAVYASAQR